MDRTQVYKIGDLHEDLPMVQIKGILKRKQLLGEGRKQRLSAVLIDDTGEIELVWFKGVKWLDKTLKNQIWKIRKEKETQNFASLQIISNAFFLPFPAFLIGPF